MGKRQICVSISSDAFVFGRYATVLASILRRTKREVVVRYYTRGLLPSSFSVRNLTVEFVQADETVTGIFPRHVTASAFDRLRIIRDEPEWDRCLLLDHDMACFSDLGEYFDEDFEGNLLMGVLFPSEQSLGWHMARRGGLPESLSHLAESPYFRMGPMMNLSLMRKEGTWEKLLVAHEALQQEEQLALTAATEGRTKGVANKWNQIPQWDYKDEAGGWKCPDGKVEGIVHWTGWAKPWHLNTKVWRPDLWEAERTNWEILRAGDWDKPEMWDLSGEACLEIRHWAKRGWRMKVLRGNAALPPLPEGKVLDEEKQLLRAEAWKRQQENAWNELMASPDVTEIPDGPVQVYGCPEVVFYRDLDQLESMSVSPRYVVLRGGVSAETGKRLADMGYSWQWCREKERQPGAVAEGLDYVAGPWSGEIPENAELLAWNGDIANSTV